MGKIKQNILETLKSDDEYYKGVGKNYLSASAMKILNETPHLFGIEQEDNINFLSGRYFHTMFLEKEKLVNFKTVDASTRNTNIYKDYCEQNGMTLLTKEVEELQELRDAVLAKDTIKELIYSDGNEFEVPAVMEINGKPFKGKADIVNHQNQLVIDLKTTSDISRFKWSARDYYYDSQAWIYRKLFGYDVIFIVCCKKTKTVKIFTCSDKFYETGEERVLNAIENYDMFFGKDAYEDVSQYVEQNEL